MLRQLVASLAFLLRALVLPAVLFVILKKLIGARYGITFLDYPWDHFKAMVDLISQLDLFRALFYASIPALLILLFVPSTNADQPTFSRRKVAWAFIAALAAGAPPFVSVFWARPELAFRLSFLAACCYVGLNAFLLVWIQRGLPWPASATSFARRAFPLADALAPMIVWAEYRKSHGPVLALWRPLSVGLVLLVPFLPWLLAPESATSPPPLSPAFHQLSTGDYYQVAIDESNRVVTVLQKDHRIRVFDPSTRRVLKELILPDRAELQSVAIQPQPRRLIGISLQLNRLWEIDADSFEIIRDSPIERVTTPGEFICCRTFAHPLGRLYANCGTGLFLLRQDGEKLRIAAQYGGLPGDLVFDNKRDQLIYAAWGLPLAALNPANLLLLQSLKIPVRPEHMAIDPATNRLFVAFPMEGELLVVDLETFTAQKWLSVFPGVRVLAVDQARRRLFLGGVSPIIEVRSLDDFSVIDRLSAPPWMRWLAFDAKNNRLYLTSQLHGLWELDLDHLGEKTTANFIARYDPFFSLLAWLLRNIPIRGSLGWNHV